MIGAPRYPQVEEWLRNEIGLDARSIGSTTIATAIRGRITARKVAGEAEYVGLLSQSRVEAQALIESIVVPETSFFRDLHPFVALKEWALGEWGPAHPTGVMRLLSMPCATGEEPFSMAMTLLEAGMGRFFVEGVDISDESLSKAAEGVYRRNSFRGGVREGVSRFFTGRASGEWRISDEVRKHVRFQKANVLDPAFGEGNPLYDVIFCRNLLIYLDTAAQKKVMEKIKELLSPDGFLCVGHAEAYLFSQFGFEPSGVSMAFCFRKPQGGRRALRPLPKGDPLQGLRVPLLLKKDVARPSPAKAPSALKASVLLPMARGVAPVAPPPEKPSKEAGLDEVERLANSGALTEAERAALSHIEEHGFSARAYYLLALVCDTQGRGDEAASYYRKTLYLEPEHSEALAHLSLLLRQRGEVRGAEQLQRRLLRTEKQGGLRI